MISQIDMPKGAARIIDALRAAGHEAYIVGGCVRDCLMGKVPYDWDITTSAAPPEVKALFPRTADTGLKHGTVTVLIGRFGYEVTTFRVDGAYTDNRRPDSVSFTDDLREDLLRRDFTINAMAYSRETGIVDMFDGMDDLRAGVIRGVGCPDARFKEDALRMLRAIRFSAQLGFGIEAGTWGALKANAPLIANISMERVRDELLKFLLGEHTENFARLNESGVLRHVGGGLDVLFGPNLEKNLPALRICPKDVNARLSLLLAGAADAKIILRFLKLDNDTIKYVSTLAGHLPDPLPASAYDMRCLLHEIGPEAARGLIQLKRIQAEAAEDAGGVKACENADDLLRRILEAGDCFDLSRLNISGERLKALGVSEGREIGRVLNDLLDAVMRNPLANDAQTLNELASAMIAQKRFSDK